MSVMLRQQQLCTTRQVTPLSCESYYNVKLATHTHHVCIQQAKDDELFVAFSFNQLIVFRLTCSVGFALVASSGFLL